MHISCLLDHFRGALKKAGLPAIRFHDLRHTAVTLMLADGVPLVTVSKILGHSSPAMALRADAQRHHRDDLRSCAGRAHGQCHSRAPAASGASRYLP
jgi:integrase